MTYDQTKVDKAEVTAVPTFAITASDGSTLTTADYDITYTSSDDTKATVALDGKVTGVGVGDVTITATLTPKNPRKCYGAEFTFNMTATAKGVHFSDPKECYIKVGDNYTLADKVQKMDIDGDITYSSGNTDVATVNASTGEVTAVAAGDAIITATADGHSDTYTVHVVDFHFNASSGTLINQNGSETLDVLLTNSTGESLTSVSSSAEGVATATATDATHIRLTAVSGGTANITASITGYHGLSLSDTYEVTVENFYFTTATKAMKLDGLLNAGDLLNNTTGQTPAYASDNSAVATIDKEGNITVEGEGSTTITASVTIDGTTYDTTFTLYVVDFGFTTASGILPLDDASHTKVLTLTNGTGEVPTFSSSDEEVATVRSDRNTVTITPVGEGTAKITATINYMGAEITTDYTVNVRTFRYSPSSANISVGDKVTTVSLTNNTGATPTYRSSNTAVAGVTTDGTVVGIGEGTATITATVTVDGQEYSTNYMVTVGGIPTPLGTTTWDFTKGFELSAADEAYWVSYTPYGTEQGYKYKKGYAGTIPLYLDNSNLLPETEGLTFYRDKDDTDNRTIVLFNSGYKRMELGVVTLNIPNVRIGQKVVVTMGNRTKGRENTLNVTGAKLRLDDGTLQDWSSNRKLDDTNYNTGSDFTFLPNTDNVTVAINAGGRYDSPLRLYKIVVTDAKQFGTATLTYDKTALSEDEGHNVATKTGLSVVKYGTTDESIDLSIYDVTYVSSDPSIATVDAETGKVTAVAPGSVTITAVLTPKAAYAADYYPVQATATISVNLTDEFVWVKNGTTVMNTEETKTVEVNLTDVDKDNHIDGLPAINMGTATGTVTYSSSVPSVAGYYTGENALRFKSPGTTIITAKAASGEEATYTLVVKADDVAGNLAGANGLYTFEQTGVLATTKTSITHSGVTMTFGHEGETALVVPDAVVGTALKIIDANGFSHAYTALDRILPPDDQWGGTYVTFQSGVKGVLTVVGHFDNPTFYDATGGTDATKTIDGNILTATLEENHLYYLYNGAPGANNPTPLVHAFGYSISEEIDFSKFQWLANNASSNSRLDRTIPRWNVKFNGGTLKFENAEFRENHPGSICFQNNVNSGNETITLSPRLLDGGEGCVLITGVEIYVNKASEVGNSKKITGSPQVNVNDGTPVNVTEGWMTIPMSEPYASAVIKRVTTGNGNSFNVSGVRVSYTVTGGKTVAEVLNTTKLGPTVYLKDSRGNDASIRPYVQIKTPNESDANTYQWTYNPVDPLNTEKDKFKSGVFTYTSSNPSVATVSVGTTQVHSGKTYADGTTMAEDRNGKDDGTNWYYQPTITMVHPLSYGYAYVVASYEGNDYFAATKETLRVYGYDYEEPVTIVLAPGESYKTPSTAGQQFELTASASTDDFKVDVTGVEGGDVVSGQMTFGTTSNTQKASITGSEITITNPAESGQELTITLVKVDRYRAKFSLEYLTGNSKKAGHVGFSDELLNASLVLENRTDGSATPEDFLSHYTISYSCERNNENTAYTLDNDDEEDNGKKGAITLGKVDTNAKQGRLIVTALLQPKLDSPAYAPLTATYEIYATDAQWNFYNEFSQSVRNSGLSTDQWSLPSNMYRINQEASETPEYVYGKDGNADNGNLLPMTYGLKTQSVSLYWVNGENTNPQNSYMHLPAKARVVIPGRKGMILTVCAVAQGDEMQMSISNVVDKDDQSSEVKNFILNSDDWKTSTTAVHSFIVKDDGPIELVNKNQQSWEHIYYIALSEEILLRDSEDVYMEVVDDEGTFTYKNIIQNATSSDTFSYELEDPDDIIEGTPDSEGNVRIKQNAFGTASITVTGTLPGSLLYQKEKKYRIHMVKLHVIHEQLTASYDNKSNTITETGGEGRTTNLTDMKNNLRVYVDSEKHTSADWLKEVVFTIETNSRPSNRANISLSGEVYSFSAQGLGELTIKAQLGTRLYKTYTIRISGVEFADVNPVIPHNSTEYELNVFDSDDKYTSVTYSILKVIGNLASMTTAANIVPSATDPKVATLTGIKKDTGNDDEKGGCIVVQATATGEGKTTTFNTVITVPYQQHVWMFYNESTPSATGLTISEGEPANFPDKIPVSDEYFDPKYPAPNSPDNNKVRLTYKPAEKDWRYEMKMKSPSATVHGVFMYIKDFRGTNGYIIEETNGLQFFNEAYTIGVDKGTKWEHSTDPQPETVNPYSILIANGANVDTYILIPQVPAGRQIDINWMRHSEDQGQRVGAENLLDVSEQRQLITEPYYIAHTENKNHDNHRVGAYSFIVAGEEGTLVDVKIRCLDATSLTIFRIELRDGDCAFGEYRPCISENLKISTAEQQQFGKEIEYVRLETGEKQTVSFNRTDQVNAIMSAGDLDSPIQMDPTLKDMDVKLNGSSQYTYEFTEGWGKFYMTVTNRTNDDDKLYVASQRTWTFTVGKKPVQNYPYTWDFTRYFVDSKTTLSDDLVPKVDDNPATRNYDPTFRTNTWSLDGTTATLITDNYKTSTYQSYYVDGAQLVSPKFTDTDGSVPELEGLGFDLDKINGGEGSISLNLVSATVEKLAGGKRSAKRKAARTIDGKGELSISGTGTIIVPKPEGEDFRTSKSNYYIYVVADKEPSVSGGKLEKVSSDMYGDETLPNKKKYVYKILTDENQRLTFTDAKVGMIGVTNIFRTMHKVGDTAWATWSHEHVLDHALTGYFTTNDVKANTVKYDSYDQETATVALTQVAEDGYMPEETGLVLRQTLNIPKTSLKTPKGADEEDLKEQKTYDVPMFYPAVTTIAPVTVPEDNMMKPNLKETVHDSETEDGKTKFVLTNVHWTFKEDGNLSQEETTAKKGEEAYYGYKEADAAGFYRMHIWKEKDSETNKKMNTMEAHSAYLLVPTEQLPTAVWEMNVGSGKGAPALDGKILIRGLHDAVDDEEESGDPEEAESDWAESTGHGWYTISGLRLPSRPTKPGLYLYNGRKVAVK